MTLPDLGLEPPPTMPTGYTARRVATMPAPAPEPSAEPSAAPQWVAAVRNWVAPPFLAAEPVMVEFAVGKLIQAGKVGALVAAGGTGKTTLLLTLAMCHATGREFLGMRVTRGTFVLLSADDPQEDLDSALALVVKAAKLTQTELDAVRQKVRVISLQGQAGLRTFTTAIGGTAVPTGLEDYLLLALEDIPDLVGVALDTLRHFAGGKTVDEDVITTTIAGATAVANATGAYVVIPHHTGKQNFRDSVADMYCGSGSAAIADNARFVLLLQSATWSDIETKVRRTGQERGDPLVLTSTRGSLLVRPPDPIYLHRDGFCIGRVAGAALTHDQILDERDREVLRAVRCGAQTKNAIAAAAKGKKAAVLDRVDDLEARGFLRNGFPNGSRLRPEYVLTSEGARFLDADE